MRARAPRSAADTFNFQRQQFRCLPMQSSGARGERRRPPRGWLDRVYITPCDPRGAAEVAAPTTPSPWSLATPRIWTATRRRSSGRPRTSPRRSTTRPSSTPSTRRARPPPRTPPRFSTPWVSTWASRGSNRDNRAAARGEGARRRDPRRWPKGCSPRWRRAITRRTCERWRDGVPRRAARQQRPRRTSTVAPTRTSRRCTSTRRSTSRIRRCSAERCAPTTTTTTIRRIRQLCPGRRLCPRRCSGSPPRRAWARTWIRSRRRSWRRSARGASRSSRRPLDCTSSTRSSRRRARQSSGPAERFWTRPRTPRARANRSPASTTNARTSRRWRTRSNGSRRCASAARISTFWYERAISAARSRRARTFAD